MQSIVNDYSYDDELRKNDFLKYMNIKIIN